ncbi:hypothetical protein ACWGKQ_01380 [Streptomyces sp. NPDC054770]
MAASLLTCEYTVSGIARRADSAPLPIHAPGRREPERTGLPGRRTGSAGVHPLHRRSNATRLLAKERPAPEAGATAVGRRFQLALARLGAGTLLGALLPAAGTAVIAGEIAEVKRRRGGTDQT